MTRLSLITSQKREAQHFKWEPTPLNEAGMMCAHHHGHTLISSARLRIQVSIALNWGPTLPNRKREPF